MMAPVSTLAFVMTQVINIPDFIQQTIIACTARQVNANVKYLLFALWSAIKVPKMNGV